MNWIEKVEVKRKAGWLDAIRLRLLRRNPRSLELCETLSLGDRRFIAIVRCGEERLLLGATSNSISLLSHLPVALAAQFPKNDVEASV